MAHNELLDQEFAFVTLDDSCKDLHSIGEAYLLDRFCRRVRGHKRGKHACGFGSDRVEWLDITAEDYL